MREYDGSAPRITFLTSAALSIFAARMRFKFFLILLLLATGVSTARAESVSDTLPPAKQPSKFLFFPFGARSPETGWGLGGAGLFFFKTHKQDPTLRTSDVNLIAFATEKHQLIFYLNSTVFFPHEKKVLRYQGSFSYYPDKTWGIGNDSRKADLERYSYHQFFINPQWLYRTFSKLYVGASYEFQRWYDMSYERGGILDRQAVTGRSGGNTSGIGVLFTWDTRNNAYSPTQGIFSELNYTVFNTAVGSNWNFSTLSFDFRKFRMLRKNTVLALQYQLRMNNGTTPIRNMAMVGGTEMMRGYYKGRYTDKSMTAAQVEVRQFLLWRLGMVAFASAGEVGATPVDFSLNGMHYAWGGGLRLLLKADELLNLRIDYGFGHHSQGLYVVVKEAF